MFGWVRAMGFLFGIVLSASLKERWEYFNLNCILKYKALTISQILRQIQFKTFYQHSSNYYLDSPSILCSTLHSKSIQDKCLLRLYVCGKCIFPLLIFIFGSKAVHQEDSNKNWIIYVNFIWKYCFQISN